MPKLFLFGIGGTGSRVIKSLTMLLASGVKINADEIVPIIVDPHASNKDLKRTISALKNYQATYRALGDNRQGFFANRITTLDNLVANDHNLPGAFSFDLKGIQNQKFNDYIDFNNLDPTNRALASLLFSKTNLETTMDIGFVGNPNIGSVVLNQFKDSQEFINFASNFNEDDRVFIISSIFGGTGAAGFPLILKNIRNAQQPLPNHDFVKNAVVGAVTVLPYFGVSPNEKTKIDKATFISKTKAALAYYGLNVTGNRSINALYYIGDEETRDYPNDPGEGGQKNDAHFVETAAALSIIDFMEMGPNMLATHEGRAATEPHFAEFGVKNDAHTLHFSHLGQRTQASIAKPLTQYFFAIQFLQQKFQNLLGKGEVFAEKNEPKITPAFTGTGFYNTLCDFNNLFIEWLEEMARNKRSFTPFHFDADLKNIVAGIPSKRGLFSKSLNFNHFVDRMNKAEQKIQAGTPEGKLMDLLRDATDDLLSNKFDYFKNLT